LAFDTIFAEGQRRYVESLSSYARQFLGRMDKPDLDYIEGLSPAISIEQKTTHRNPRSTVGTVTEIYDYYRLLFARIGIPHCPKCGREIREQSVDQIIDTLQQLKPGTKIQILAPVIRAKKGEHQKVLDDARKAGFARARIDGLIVPLDDTIKLDKQKKHTIEIVVDRLALSEGVRTRLAEAVETALNSADGIMMVLVGSEGEGKGEGRREKGEGKSPLSETVIPEETTRDDPQGEPQQLSSQNPHSPHPTPHTPSYSY
jgi:excinuclease ABC subunit A